MERVMPIDLKRIVIRQYMGNFQPNHQIFVLAKTVRLGYDAK
jgi:hypothetical protein